MFMENLQDDVSDVIILHFVCSYYGNCLIIVIITCKDQRENIEIIDNTI
jgi:hypothetical protein